MFEKEAEEYREKEKEKGYYWVTREMEQSELDTIIDESFRDGATFGYNKAKEEIQKNGLALQSDMDKTIEQNIALKAQIEKMKCCIVSCCEGCERLPKLYKEIKEND